METLDSTELLPTAEGVVEAPTNNDEIELSSDAPISDQPELVADTESASAITADIEISEGPNESTESSEVTSEATAVSTEFKPVKNPLLFPSMSEDNRKFVKKIQGLIMDNNGRGKPRNKDEDVEIEVDRQGRRHRRVGRGKHTARQYEPRHDIPFTTEVRPNVVHVYGTDRCSNSDLFAYFSQEYPHEIEWINDSSCNIVFKNEEFAQKALKNHEIPNGKESYDADTNSSRGQRQQQQQQQKRKAVDGSTPATTTSNIDSPPALEKPLCTPPPPSPTPSSLKSEIRVDEANSDRVNQNTEGKLNSAGPVNDDSQRDEDDEDENMLDREAEDGVRIIPWVKCRPFKAGESGVTVNLQIRQATVEDVKSENRKKSLYYKRIADEHKSERKNFRHSSYSNPCKKIRLSDERSYNNDGTITISRK